MPLDVFPKCEFKVLLDGGAIVAGELARGTLVLEVPKPIPRASHIHFFLRSTAVAGYGSGKNRRVYTRDMLLLPIVIPLPKDRPLPAGTFNYPFELDIPPWLPPAYLGPDCKMVHEIEARLDVDWAIDPKTTLIPAVVHRPVERAGSPVTVRSPAGFHKSIVVELTLPSTVVAHDQPVEGRVALRGGHDVRFDALVLSLEGIATVVMGRGDRRRGGGMTVRIPADQLRDGRAIPFAFPPRSVQVPTIRTGASSHLASPSGFIDHDVVLTTTVDIPWAFDPSFEVTLEMLPAGSRVYVSDVTVAEVGMERVRQLSAALSQATGLRAARPPGLVEGNVGPVSIYVADGPRSGALGVDVQMGFPDLDLGITFRPLGMLEGFRTSPHLPAPLGDRYLLRLGGSEERPPPDGAALDQLFSAILGGLGSVEEVRLADHQLGVHFTLADDRAERLFEIVRSLQARAQAIADAIARMPSPAPVEASRAAWVATAAEQGAVLVPHVPALHGIVLRARVLGGEERAARVTIRAEWPKGGPPGVAVDVDLSDAPLPKAARAALENETEQAAAALRSVRAVLPTIEADSDVEVTLSSPAFAPDPRALLSAIELFFWWVLDARGERRTDAPYR